MSPYRFMRLLLLVCFVGSAVVALVVGTVEPVAGWSRYYSVVRAIGLLLLGGSLYLVLGSHLLPPIPQLPIRRLEEYLGKGEDERPQRFRDFGPRWIDFEAETTDERYIYHRTEAEEILHKLLKEGKHKVLMLGSPGSGKTVIAWDVGYQLSRFRWRPWHVYYHALKAEPLDEESEANLLERLATYPEPVLVILDDAHLEVGQASRVLRRASGPQASVLVMSQPHFERDQPPGLGEQHPLKRHCDSQVEVGSWAAFAEVARWGMRQEMKRAATADDIEALREECGDDLLFLTWYLRGLQTYDDDRVHFEATRARVYEQIGDFLARVEDRLRPALGPRRAHQAPELLLLISEFFQYEVPVFRGAVEEELGYDRDVADALLKEGWLQELATPSGRFLSSYHMSLSRLHLRAAAAKAVYPLSRLRETFSPWPRSLWRSYIMASPPGILNALWRVRDRFQLELREWLAEDSIRKAIIHGVTRCYEDTPFCIGRYMSVLHEEYNPVWAEEAWEGLAAHLAEASSCSSNAPDIIGCIKKLFGCSAAWGEKIWAAVGPDRLAQVLGEADAWAMGECIWLLHTCHPAWAKELWEQLGVDRVADAVKAVEPYGVGRCFHSIHICNPDWSRDLWERVGCEEVARAVGAGHAFDRAASIRDLCFCEHSWGMKVWERIGLRQAVEAIRATPAAFLVGNCFAQLRDCDSAWAEALWCHPGVKEAVVDGVNRATAGSAASCLSDLHSCNRRWAEYVWRRLCDRLRSRVEERGTCPPNFERSGQ